MIKVKNKSLSLVKYFEEWEQTYGAEIKSQSKSVWALGDQFDGRSIIKECQQHNNLLITGSAGSGKTELIYSLITQRLYQNPKTVIEINSLTHPDYDSISPYTSSYSIQHSDDPDKISTLRASIDRFLAEIYRRKELFKSGVIDINEYNQSPKGKRLDDWILVIDGHTDSFFESALNNPEVETSLHKLYEILRTGRRYGVQVIISTQSPRRITNIAKELCRFIVLNSAPTDESYLDLKESTQSFSPGEYLISTEEGFVKASNHFIGKANLPDLIKKMKLKKRPQQNGQ